jgi:GAF domain-containing protein
MTQSIPRTTSLKSRVQTLEEERQQTQRALDALYRIGLACRGQNDPKTLLTTIYNELRTVWNFDACYIALCDHADSTNYRLALLVDEELIEFSEHDPVGVVTGYMIQHRQPLLFDDLVTERTRVGLPETTHFGSEKSSRAWMGVPLLFGQNALGVISLQSYTVGLFKPTDLELLSRLANSMAVALENATLSHRQAELTQSLAQQVELRNADLFVISDIAAMLTQQQPLPAMFGMALDFMLDLMSLDAGAVCGVQDDEFVPVAQRGLSDPGLPPLFAASSTILGASVDANTTILAADLGQGEWTLPPALQDLTTAMVIPLRRSDAVIGILLVGHRSPREFKSEEVELLQVVGNQLALALEHGYILEQQQRQIAELEALSHISYAASRSLDAATLLAQMHTAIQAFLPLDVFFMAIYDPERDVLTDSIAIEAGQEARYITHDTTPRPGSFTEWVIKHRQTLFLRHVSEDLARQPEFIRTTITGLPSESWLGVPMLDSHERPLGVISIQSYQSNAFTNRDRFFLQAVASQVSLHVINVRLFQQRERQLAELNALQRISALISSTLDIEPMIQSIDEVLTDFLHVDAFFVALYSHENKTLEALYVLEYGVMQAYDAMVGQPMPARTPTAWVVEQAQPLRFNDVEAETANHPDFRALSLSEDSARSWLGVPLIGRSGRTIGALTVQSYTAGIFSARDEQFMLQVARQLTLAIQNARLFAQRERQLAELDALQRITELTSSTLDLRQMLRSIDVVLRSFLRADAFQVVIYDIDRDRVEMAVVLENGRDVPTKTVGQPLGEDLMVGWTLRRIQPLRLANIYAEWRQYPGLSEPPVMKGKPKLSWLSVPLMETERRPLGVLAVRAQRENAFGPSDERFLINVGRQLALSVRNARLFAAEQTAHRTADTMREIARVLNTSFNPDEVLTLILRELKKVVDYDSASVMLPSNNMLRMVARQANEADDDGRWRELTFPIDPSSGAGRVMLTGRPSIINDTVADASWTPSPMSQVVRSWVGVPLISKNMVLGVLNINGLHAHNFTANDAEIALTFANQAATALEHARLYQESVTRVEQELEIARRIQSNLFPRELPADPGVALAVLCHPARETGGDFFDVLELPSGKWGLIVGDASGKSIPGAMLMAVARSIARSEARNHEVPEVVMRETNDWVTRDVPPHTFVAMSYATLDPRSGALALSNAGQLDPILVRADGTLEYLTTGGPHFPLGIVGDTAYESAAFTLRPNDVLLFYTDGVVEAKRAGGEMWGFDRLEELLREQALLLTPGQLIATIISSINEFIENYPQHDDITLVAVRMEEMS